MLDVDAIAGGRDCRDSIASVLVRNNSACGRVRDSWMALLVGRAYSMHQDP